MLLDGDGFMRISRLLAQSMTPERLDTTPEGRLAIQESSAADLHALAIPQSNSVPRVTFLDLLFQIADAYTDTVNENPSVAAEGFHHRGEECA